MQTIQQVAKQFAISARTLRYYEELGLLTPKRTETGQRLYSKKEMVKLQLVMRGKRFGFTLDEIKEMVLLFDLDRTGKKQLQRTIAYGEEKLAEIDEKIAELYEIKREMEQLNTIFKRKLNKLEE
ncbi:MerR family transcriptional regulator [Lysinibacillus alkalisoli]|uniref:MerR family transcriptional regulator n=1 Tax=Lysinibacillus alkalisoli TaxID=1911548 RepID=A0A917D611_9BACI|nr:MerR family transcriptional regulator [Lysinibacillus alkalisoli]GGG12161.1 MerR family transcriptional regulator [Lysinibacillus alkalisoli]